MKPQLNQIYLALKWAAVIVTVVAAGGHASALELACKEVFSGKVARLVVTRSGVSKIQPTDVLNPAWVTTASYDQGPAVSLSVAITDMGRQFRMMTPAYQHLIRLALGTPIDPNVFTGDMNQFLDEFRRPHVVQWAKDLRYLMLRMGPKLVEVLNNPGSPVDLFVDPRNSRGLSMFTAWSDEEKFEYFLPLLREMRSLAGGLRLAAVSAYFRALNDGLVRFPEDALPSYHFLDFYREMDGPQKLRRSIRTLDSSFVLLPTWYGVDYGVTGVSIDPRRVTALMPLPEEEEGVASIYAGVPLDSLKFGLHDLVTNSVVPEMQAKREVSGAYVRGSSTTFSEYLVIPTEDGKLYFLHSQAEERPGQELAVRDLTQYLPEGVSKVSPQAVLPDQTIQLKLLMSTGHTQTLLLRVEGKALFLPEVDSDPAWREDS